MDSDSVRLEEYRIVSDEKTQQYKRRDFATYPGIALIVAMLAYRVQNPDTDIAINIFTMLATLFLYYYYIYATLLGLKADAYICVFLEPHYPELNWYTQKNNYGIGLIRGCYRWTIILIFLFLIMANLHIMWKDNDVTAATIGIPTVTLFIFASVKYYREDYGRLIRIWERKKSILEETLNDQISTE